jgi:diadenosine tetraphosphate (Ap4A) HIT family hydrolase
MGPCVFCRILAGELPASPVLDTDLVVAFLDIQPWNPGHTLVVPRRHVESFADLSPREVEQLALCGQRIAAAMKRGLEGCEAITLSLADGAAAGQDVPHTHLHVVPRRAGDGLGWRIPAAQPPVRERLDAIAAQLRTALAAEQSSPQPPQR